jgi:hypothetical protein
VIDVPDTPRDWSTEAHELRQYADDLDRTAADFAARAGLARAAAAELAQTAPRPRRGRPPGSRNRPAPAGEPAVPAPA